jgi:hypothetical protein
MSAAMIFISSFTNLILNALIQMASPEVAAPDVLAAPEVAAPDVLVANGPGQHGRGQPGQYVYLYICRYIGFHTKLRLTLQTVHFVLGFTHNYPHHANKFYILPYSSLDFGPGNCSGNCAF